MTITVANTSNTNTFDYWRNRTNELAHAMTTYTVTTNSNTAAGNAAISGTFTSNVISAYIVSSNTTVNVGNTSANIVITSPTSGQISDGGYYLNANGSWSLNTSAPISNGSVTTSGTSQQEIDSFAFSELNAAEYYVHIKDNVGNNYHASKVLVVHNNGASYSTEYATVISNNTMGVFQATANATHVRFLLTPTTGDTTVTYTRVNF